MGALTATLLATRPGDQPTVTIPAGASFVATLEHQLSTADSKVGQEVTLRTPEPLRINEEFTLPAGIVIRGVVLQISSDSGVAELAVGFTRLEIAGESEAIAAGPLRVGRPAPAGRAKKAAVGSGAEGTGLDDGAGVVTGDHIVLPVGRRIRIRLSEPVTVRFRGSRTTLGRARSEAGADVWR